MKSLFEQIGGTYTQVGNYFLPDLKLPEEENKPIGIWGHRHAKYLEQNHKILYMSLLTSSKLNNYLADIDEQAQERFEVLIEQMKQAQGITEQLKAENVWEWVRRLNNIQACAMDIVNKEIVFA